MKEKAKEYWLVFVTAFAGFVLSDIMSIFTQNMKVEDRFIWDITAFAGATAIIGWLILRKGNTEKPRKKKTKYEL